MNQQFEEESKLLDKVVKYLEPQRRSGIKVLKIRDRYTRGYSDIFICVRGVFVVAELKDNVGKPSVEQERFIKDMQACGAIGGICRTVQDVIDLVEEAKRRQPVWPI